MADNSDFAVLNVRVIPRARKDRIDGILADGRVKIRINAPPVDGKANLRLVDFLASVLGVGKNHIVIQSGINSRDKRLRIVGKSQSEVDLSVRGESHGRWGAEEAE